MSTPCAPFYIQEALVVRLKNHRTNGWHRKLEVPLVAPASSTSIQAQAMARSLRRTSDWETGRIVNLVNLFYMFQQQTLL